MKLKLKYRILIFLLNILAKTWKIKIIGELPNKPAIVAFWHGNMLPIWKALSKQFPYAVVSPSKDGEILSQLLIKWNYKLIRGSSDKNKQETLQTIVELSSSELVLITPDGPKGPIYKFKPGAVISAMRAKVNLYLCSADIKSKYVFKNSWDKFILPKPFTQIIIQFSETIQVNQDTTRDKVDSIINYCEQKLCQMNEVNYNK